MASASADSSNTLFYNIYHNAGPTPAFIVPALIINLVSFFGILMNISIICVTIKSSSLRGPVNFLLALISFYEILHQLGHFLFLALSVSGVNFIDFGTAIRLELPSLVGMNASIFTMTLAALDRLAALLIGKILNRMNKILYLGICTAMSVSYGIYIAKCFYTSQISINADWPTTGYMSDLLRGPFSLSWFLITSALNITAVACYAAIWIVIKKKEGVSQHTNGRLLKSLLLIILVNIGAYFLDIAALQLIFNILCQNCYESFLLGWELSFINATLLNVGVALTAPILYFTSVDYRMAYNEHLFSGQLCKSRNRISTENNNNNNVVVSTQSRIKQGLQQQEHC